MRKWGPVEFSNITGIARSGLKKYHENNELRGHIDEKNHKYYSLEHFNHPLVKKRMLANNKELPDEVKLLLGVSVNSAVEAVSDDSADNAMEQQYSPDEITTYQQLSELPAGEVDVYIQPMEDLDEYARAVWKSALDNLMHQGTVSTGDLMSLRNYCTACSQLIHVENEIASLDRFMSGGKIHPLVAYSIRLKVSLKTLAASLNLTPSSRSTKTDASKSPIPGAPKQANSTENQEKWLRLIK